MEPVSESQAGVPGSSTAASTQRPQRAPFEPEDRTVGKWTIVTIFWIVQAAVGYLLTPLVLLEVGSFWEWESKVTDLNFMSWVLGSIVVFTVLQACFLFPVRRPTPAGSGASLKFSLAIAGLLAVLLAAGAVGLAIDALILMEVQLPDVRNTEFWFLGMIVAAWVPATLLLWSFVNSRRPESALARIAARLFLGTVIEAVATVPIAVMIRRKTSCYCGTGSFFSLIVCVGIGWFTLGPAIFLPMIAKRRQRWYGGHCGACGYDMRGCMNAERCPECGTGWASHPNA